MEDWRVEALNLSSISHTEHVIVTRKYDGQMVPQMTVRTFRAVEALNSVIYTLFFHTTLLSLSNHLISNADNTVLY